MVQLQKHFDDFRSRGIRVVAVSVDPPDKLAVMRAAVGAEFTFLSDPEGRLIDLFGVRHVGGNVQEGGDVAQSASFLFDADGRVVWRRVADNYRVRPRPEEILAAAAEL